MLIEVANYIYNLEGAAYLNIVSLTNFFLKVGFDIENWKYLKCRLELPRIFLWSGQYLQMVTFSPFKSDFWHCKLEISKIQTIVAIDNYKFCGMDTSKDSHIHFFKIGVWHCQSEIHNRQTSFDKDIYNFGSVDISKDCHI